MLGVSKNATLMDIKRAYRSLALECHPDRVPDYKKKEAESKFREIHEAYEVLSDLKRRKEHDRQKIYKDVDFPSWDSSESGFFDSFRDLIEEILYQFGDIQKRFFFIVVMGYILIAICLWGWQILYARFSHHPLSSLIVGILFSYFCIFPRPVVADFPIDHGSIGYRILRYFGWIFLMSIIMAHFFIMHLKLYL